MEAAGLKRPHFDDRPPVSRISGPGRTRAAGRATRATVVVNFHCPAYFLYLHHPPTRGLHPPDSTHPGHPIWVVWTKVPCLPPPARSSNP